MTESWEGCWSEGESLKGKRKVFQEKPPRREKKKTKTNSLKKFTRYTSKGGATHKRRLLIKYWIDCRCSWIEIKDQPNQSLLLWYVYLMLYYVHVHMYCF